MSDATNREADGVVSDNAQPLPPATTVPRGPRASGRLVGALKGTNSGAATYVVLRDQHSHEPVATAAVMPDGTFSVGELPLSVRGKTLDVEVTVALPQGSKTAVSGALEVPLAGDGTVVLNLGKFGAEVGTLSASPASLDAARLNEALRGYEDASAAFSKTRNDAVKRNPGPPVDLPDAVAYLETVRRPAHPAGLQVLAKDLPTLNREEHFKRPSPGLKSQPVPRTARIRLTAAEQTVLQSADPGLCSVIEARGDQRALVRRPRLRDRLEERMRIERLTITATPPGPGPGQPPGPDGMSVAQLAREAEKAALRGVTGVISDLTRDVEDPSTATDLKRLHQLASELELAGGPANVSAAREVHTLQVAFEYPVTSLIDSDLVRAWDRLAGLRAQLKSERAIDLPQPPTAPAREELVAYLALGAQVVALKGMEPPPQLVRDRYPSLGEATWARLDDAARDIVVRRCADMPAYSAPTATPTSTGTPPRTRTATATARKFGGFGGVLEGIDDLLDQIVSQVDDQTEIDELLDSSPSVIAEADRTLGELQERLRGTYEFTVAVPGTVNYGLLLTYRQEWSPIRYQVGRLIDTLPLTPGERREFKVTTTRKLHENRKTVSTQSREAQREQTSTHRLESEAIEAATMAINNQVSTNGSFNIGVGSVGGSSQFSLNQNAESRRTLKNFSEMAQKAVDSLKEQLEVTVEASTDVTTEQTESRTITNPNNEISITYLLYELERRYRVATQLQRVRPVVLVALPVPAPDEITPGWILEHSWAIRDALLDETLLDALDGLEEAQSGAAVAYEVRRAALIEQRRVARQLVTEYESLEALAQKRRETIVGLIDEEGEAASEEWGIGRRIGTAIVTGGVSEVFGFGSSGDDERAAAAREAAQKALEYLEKQIAAKGAAMTAAAEALRRAVDRFSEAAVERRRTTLATTRLQVHLRDNIFHYMHAIWAATHPDHRFFELYDDLVPFHVPDPNAYVLQPAAQPAALRDLPFISDSGADLELSVAAPDVTQVPPRRRLADIADLDRPLGYRGNFVVFELRQCSQLTDHMAAEYLDPLSGVADPGLISGISTGELIEYLEAAIEFGVLTNNDLTRLQALAVRLQREQRDWADELTLPTGQIFLEALKGQTTLLEPFKLVHRGLDVLSAEEDVRIKRIDALRRVRRVALAELERDPAAVEHFYLGEPPDIVATNGDGQDGNG